MERRRFLQGAAALGASALAGCSAMPGTENGTLRYGQVLPPLRLDPVVADDPWTRGVTNRVFRGLYEYGDGTDIRPALATGMPKKRDETTYRVTLRNDARFQNGEPVTAADVKYTFDTPREQPANSTAWKLTPVESIRTRGKRTVEFSLEHPYPAFRYALTRGIVPKQRHQADPDGFGKDPVGAGPFRVDAVKPGKYARLTAWGDYPGETPGVTQASFVPNHAGLARTTSMRTQQADVIERVHPKLWEVTEGMPGVDVRKAPSLHSHFVGFNCNEGPTADPRVRKAVDHLVDMEAAVKHFVGKTGRRQYSPLPPQVAEEWDLPVEEWEKIPAKKDVEKAKKLFDEAGVGSWSPTIAVPKDMLREKVGETIVHGLSEAGFSRARTKKYGWPEFRDKVTSGVPSDYSMFVGSWTGAPDPDTYLYPLVHEDNEGVTNGLFYRNDAVMTDIEDARRTADRAKRRKLYARATTTLLEERALLPGFTLANSFGTRENVQGLEPHPVAAANPRLVGPGGSVSIR